MPDGSLDTFSINFASYYTRQTLNVTTLQFFPYVFFLILR